MKKLLFILLLLPFLAKSQVVVNRGPITVVVQDARFNATYSFKVPVFPDTATATSYIGHDSLGMVFYNKHDSILYFRTVNPAGTKKWLPMGSGSGGGGAVSSVFTRAGNVVALTGDYAAFYPILAGAYADPSWITSLAASKIAGGQMVTPGSSKISLTGTPAGAALQPFTIDVVPANINLSTLGGLLNVNQINATGVYNDSNVVYENGTWGRLPAGGGGGGVVPSNIGTGYRFVIPFTGQHKTLFLNSYMLGDSTTNTNGITVGADTTKLATKTDLARYTNANLDTVLSRGGTISADRTSAFGGKLWSLSNIKSFDLSSSTPNTNLAGGATLTVGDGNWIGSSSTFDNIVGGNGDSVYHSFRNIVFGYQNILGSSGGSTQVQDNALFGHQNRIIGTGTTQGNLIVGTSNIVDFSNNIVGGINDTASGSGSSFIVGNGNHDFSSGINFIAGRGNHANHSFQTLLGQWTDTSANNYVFAIGNGSAAGSRHNAFAIDNNNYMYGTGVVNAAGFKFLWPTDGLNDTVATRNFVRGIGGGGGGGGGSNPFSDNTALIKNNADNSKLAILSAASITTGTTRTYTLPDVNGTVDLASNTATLTNKSISATTNTITNLTNANLNAAGITNANLATMAANTFKVNNTGSPAVPIDATATQATAMLNTFTSSTQGLVPASGGGSSNWLNSNGGFIPIPPTPLGIGHTGTSTIWGGYPDIAGDSLYFKSGDPNFFKTKPDSTISIDTSANLTHLATQGYVGAHGGGGSSFTRQSITSGTSVTVTGGEYIVTFNPASVIATYALTLPASPSDMDEVEIEAGGTVTSGNPVVTALNVIANSGQTLVQAVTPTTINSGEFIKYRYRTANTSWYRRN